MVRRIVVIVFKSRKAALVAKEKEEPRLDLAWRVDGTLGKGIPREFCGCEQFRKNYGRLTSGNHGTAAAEFPTFSLFLLIYGYSREEILGSS